MSDLISRGKLFNLLAPVQTLGEAYGIIQGMETVDAVPVVRKPVKGYEGYYEVDCFGRVYSLDRTVSVNDNGRMYDKPVVGRVMGQTVKSNGYKCVSLTKDGESKAFYVHRLVADAFIPNPDDLPMVNHKDEDKSNNFVENLEWCTNEYNINYGTGKERRAKKIRGKVSPHAVHIEAFGERHTRKEWGNMYGIDPKSIARRMSRGWSAEKAISTPLMKNQYAFERKAMTMAEYPQREYIVRETEYPLGYTKEEEVCELVRCKDCKSFSHGYCRFHDAKFVRPDGYCYWGERKDGEQ